MKKLLSLVFLSAFVLPVAGNLFARPADSVNPASTANQEIVSRHKKHHHKKKHPTAYQATAGTASIRA